MTTETQVIIAGFGHSVSKTHLSSAAQGAHVNILARTLLQIEADWRRILATRDSVSETHKPDDEKNSI